jgi:hypothetical protein
LAENCFVKVLIQLVWAGDKIGSNGVFKDVEGTQINFSSFMQFDLPEQSLILLPLSF